MGRIYCPNCERVGCDGDCFSYPRPQTRGELKEKLEQGISCEVVSDNAETTCFFLKEWLGLDGFTVYPSENEGWSMFESLKEQK